MDYDTLQYCDFLGSVCSIWVTILCMARITDIYKYVSRLLSATLPSDTTEVNKRF